MSTLEEKILDGPRVHYCDADDDDIRVDEGDQVEPEDKGCTKNDAASLFRRPNDDDNERLNRIVDKVNWRKAEGSTNTGPKGVIADQRRYMSAGPWENNLEAELEAEFQALLNDDTFIREYAPKRILDALRANMPTFGQVQHLQTGDQLLNAIDNEKPNVTIVVHIYTKYSRPCMNLNQCLGQLANEYKQVKFVTLDASVAGLSKTFKENGVPALLIYKSGNLVKSLLQLSELLDKDFEADQVRDLLIDNEITI